MAKVIVYNVYTQALETFYLEEKDIMYAWPEDDQTVRIHLMDGTEKTSASTLLNFCANLDFDVDSSNRGIEG